MFVVDDVVVVAAALVVVATAVLSVLAIVVMIVLDVFAAVGELALLAVHTRTCASICFRCFVSSRWFS